MICGLDYNLLLEIKLSGHTNTLAETSNLKDEYHEKGETKKEQQYWVALDKFYTKRMQLSRKFMQLVPLITRAKIEEHMLIIMDKSTHEESLSQPLQRHLANSNFYLLLVGMKKNNLSLLICQMTKIQDSII